MPDTAEALRGLLEAALDRRRDLLARLHREGTDCYRLLHGIAEGAPGVTLDRYGSLLLLQTFRAPLPAAAADALAESARRALGAPLDLAYNHRGPGAAAYAHSAQALAERACTEAGRSYLIRARHRGRDPWLFLDLRAGRRLLPQWSGRAVLNLFAYTCSAGIAAAARASGEVWNVDFSGSALAVGKRNAACNGLASERFRCIESDCIPLLRQLAGQPVQRRTWRRRYLRIEKRTFDLIVLDPPRWAKSPFGTIDVVADYAALFKPCVLALAERGAIVATSHVPEVAAGDWLESLRRCAAKAGRPLRAIELVSPDADFPSFDGQPPLKIAVCEV
jgi:23S rRNA (cytosine1962-C5)-methyltransferase